VGGGKGERGGGGGGGGGEAHGCLSLANVVYCVNIGL